MTQWRVIALAIVYKLYLVALAVMSQICIEHWSGSSGYDTSTTVYLDEAATLTKALVRWDSIYFTNIADKGEYTYEQEQAFGLYWPLFIRYLSASKEKEALALASIAISFSSHIASLIALYKLTMHLLHSSIIATLTIAFHALSPAGIFLCAGYTESTTCFLLYTAMYIFELGKDQRNMLLGWTLWIASGLIIGITSGIRPSAMLFMGLYALHALALANNARQRGILTNIHRFTLNIFVLGISALLCCSGFVYLQYAAWTQFCFPTPTRPWCSHTIPAIYTFVQSEYWNVGFLRYWTVSQLPNFALALPILLNSIKSCFSRPFLTHGRERPYLILQGIFTLLAITSMHVQIATRVMTCFPGLYWFLARSYLQRDQDASKLLSNWSRTILPVFVLYASIQSILFGAFLPPA